MSPADPQQPRPPADNPTVPLGDRTMSLSDFVGGTDSGGSAPQPPPYSNGTTTATGSSTGSGLSSSSFFNHGRFVPGTIVAGRYRIVAMAGKGGMGEVYRADDLRVGQTVALKFLPPGVAVDPVAVARLHTEVRLAREIAHPNVCRVYDVGEVDGTPFLSMQYVDGENLATLLRRIDRLPHEKAEDLARQLATGIAAAHDRGVLHRDLKPANVMLDERGKLLVTDFGLSAAAADSGAEKGIVGTPAYMAPEQLAGQPATVRSDLYALGLLMYELFTGRPVFKADTYDALMRQRERFDPARLAESMERVEVPAPVVRMVLRCLERDPLRRPASAMAVLAALPGGDPLAAALAAGETPTPEMVAAAGGTGALTARRAAPLLAAVVLPVIVLALINAALHEAAPPVPVDDDPAVLADHARQTLKSLGHADEGAFSASGVEWDRAFFAYRDPDARAAGPGTRRHAGTFWYRQSPRRLVPSYLSMPVTLTDPPLAPGMVTLVMGPGRQLLRFTAAGPAYMPAGGGADGPDAGLAGPDSFASGGVMPAAVPGARAVAKPSTAPPAADWAPFLEKAQLDDPAALAPTEPLLNPPVNSDRRYAWTVVPRAGGAARSWGAPVRVEAASLAGRPVHFAVLRPWEVPSAGAAVADSSGPATGPFSSASGAPAPAGRPWLERAFDYVAFVVRLTLWVAAAALAIRNARAGRSDRRNAFRLGLAVFVLHTIGTLMRAAHQPPSVAENTVVFNCLAQGIFRGAMAWLFYLALEPYVRRAWPDWLISWTRLLGGMTVRDPLVGLAVAAVTTAVSAGLALAAVKGLGVVPTPASWEIADAMRSTPSIVAVLLWNVSFAAIAASAIPFVAAAIFHMTGSRRAALPAAAAFLFLLMFAPSPAPVASAAGMGLTAVTVLIAVVARLWALAKYGVLGLAACSLALFARQTIPPIFDATAWYVGAVWTVTSALLLMAGVAFALSTGTRYEQRGVVTT